MEQTLKQKNVKLEAMRTRVKLSLPVLSVHLSPDFEFSNRDNDNPQLSQPTLSPFPLLSPTPITTTQPHSSPPIFFKSRVKNAFIQHYHILQKLGQGANGIIHKCQHKTTQHISAVKIGEMQQQHIFLLKKINKLLKRVQNKHILKMNQIYIDASRYKYYQLMQYLPYPSLKRLIADDHQFSNNTIRKITKQLYEGLLHLGQCRIVHRDIKTDNLLYDISNQHLYIIDLGTITATVERGRRRNLWTNTGTLQYKAPETLKYSSYNEGVDVWAGGVVLYELVEGRTPFKEESQMDTIQNIIGIRYQFEGRRWEEIPLAKDLVQRVLRDKRERLSCNEVLRNPWFQLMQQKPTLSKIQYSPYAKQKSSSNSSNPFNLLVHSSFSTPTPTQTKLFNSEQAKNGITKNQDEEEIDGLELFRVYSENSCGNYCVDPVGVEGRSAKDLFGEGEEDVISNDR